MEYPPEVITITKKGKREVRKLVDHGTFVRYEYLDLNTGKRAENKTKLVLFNGKDYEEYFIIPLKQRNRYLLLKADKKGERKLWSDGSAVSLFSLLKCNNDEEHQ